MFFTPYKTIENYFGRGNIFKMNIFLLLSQFVSILHDSFGKSEVTKKVGIVKGRIFFKCHFKTKKMGV